MGHRTLVPLSRLLRGAAGVRAVIAGGAGIGLAATLGDVFAQDRPKVGADITDGPVANNGDTAVSMIDGVPVIEEVRRRGRGNGGGRGSQDDDGSDSGSSAGDASGGAGNLAFVS